MAVFTSDSSKRIEEVVVCSSLTFMVGGKKRVEHIPKEWVEEVQRLVEAGREFKEAVAEVFAANAQLLARGERHRQR